MISRRYLL